VRGKRRSGGREQLGLPLWHCRIVIFANIVRKYASLLHQKSLIHYILYFPHSISPSLFTVKILARRLSVSSVLVCVILCVWLLRLCRMDTSMCHPPTSASLLIRHSQES